MYKFVEQIKVDILLSLEALRLNIIREVEIQQPEQFLPDYARRVYVHLQMQQIHYVQNPIPVNVVKFKSQCVVCIVHIFYLEMLEGIDYLRHRNFHLVETLR